MRVIATIAGLAALAPAPLAAQSAGQPILLEDIVLSANRAESDAARTGSAVTVATGAEIAPAGEPFLIESLARLPGLTTQQAGPPGTLSGFAIRGVGQNYVRVLADGIDIADPTGTQVAASLSGLLAPGFGRVEVLRGSQSAIWGGQAVGGVITLSTPPPERDGLTQALRLEGGAYDTALAGYTLGYRGARAEGSLTITGLTSDGFSAAEENDGNTEPDGVKAGRVSLTGTVYATDAVSLFGTLFRQYERGEFDAAGGPDGDDPDNYARTRSTGLLAGVTLDGGGIEHRAGVSRFDIDRESFSFSELYVADGTRTRVDYLGAARISDALSLQVGADWTREETRSATVVGSAAATEASRVGGLFAQATYTPSDALALTAALRGDDHSAFGTYRTARLTAAWLATPDTTLRGSFGTGFRAPSNYELYDPFSGNPDLDPETSVSWDLGVERRFAGGQVSASVFRLEIDDLIDYVGVFLPPDFACTGPCSYVQVPGTSTAKGVELAADYALSDRWRLAAAYTYTDATGPDGTRRNRIPRHHLAVTLSGAPTERLDLAVTGRFAGDVIDASAALQPGQFDGIGDHAVVDARLGYDVTDRAQVYLRVENLFDAEYQTARGYGASDRAVYAGLVAQF